MSDLPNWLVQEALDELERAIHRRMEHKLWTVPPCAGFAYDPAIKSASPDMVLAYDSAIKSAKHMIAEGDGDMLAIAIKALRELK